MLDPPRSTPAFQLPMNSLPAVSFLHERNEPLKSKSDVFWLTLAFEGSVYLQCVTMILARRLKFGRDFKLLPTKGTALAPYRIRCVEAWVPRARRPEFLARRFAPPTNQLLPSGSLPVRGTAATDNFTQIPAKI